MSLGTNGASAAQLEDPNHENEFVASQADLQAIDTAAAETAAKSQDASDGALMAAAASDSPASA